MHNLHLEVVGKHYHKASCKVIIKNKTLFFYDCVGISMLMEIPPISFHCYYHRQFYHVILSVNFQIPSQSHHRHKEILLKLYYQVENAFYISSLDQFKVHQNLLNLIANIAVMLYSQVQSKQQARKSRKWQGQKHQFTHRKKTRVYERDQQD